jgi:hypothetical protein
MSGSKPQRRTRFAVGPAVALMRLLPSRVR